MKKRIEEFLETVNPKNKAVEFYALCLFAMMCFENDDFEMIEFLDRHYYGEMISKGYGFSNPESKFSPSVVEFGEFVEFLNTDIQKMKKGELSKEEVRARNWQYFQEYIAKVEY